MDNARDITRAILETINIDDSGFFDVVTKGFISRPVNLGYLEYDFIDDFVSRINMQSLGVGMIGSEIGNIFFTQWTGIHLGYVISERAVTSLFAGTIMGSLLSMDSEISRVIYTPRYQRERNTDGYYKQRDMEDLEFIYVLLKIRLNLLNMHVMLVSLTWMNLIIFVTFSWWGYEVSNNLSYYFF